MGIDYSVSSTSVYFQSGAADGEERCINITAISDDRLEEEEVIIPFLKGATTYQLNLTGAEYGNSLIINIMDSTGELNSSWILNVMSSSSVIIHYGHSKFKYELHNHSYMQYCYCSR